MNKLIFLFLTNMFSLQAMESVEPIEVESQSSNMWVSAKLLHAFLPVHEFKKLGPQLFDGGKDGKIGTVDITINEMSFPSKKQQLIDDMQKKFPQEVLRIIDFYLNKHDYDLIKQAYVNSYTVHQAFPQDTWKKIIHPWVRHKETIIWKTPYKGPEGKRLWVSYNERHKPQYFIETLNSKERPNYIPNDTKDWVQEKGIYFFIAPEEKTIKYLDLWRSMAPAYEISVDSIIPNIKENYNYTVKGLLLDYRRNLLLCCIEKVKKSKEYYPRSSSLYALSYTKKNNQELSFNKSKLLKRIDPNSYKNNYDYNSGLCYHHFPSTSFYDIFTGKRYVKQQNIKSLSSLGFDSNIGIFGIGENKDAYILKPQLDYEKMENFIKTITPYDRILMHAVLKQGRFIFDEKFDEENAQL